MPVAHEHPEANAALTAAAARAIRPTCLALAGLFVVFAWIDNATLPQGAAQTVALADAVVSFVAQLAWWALRQKALPVRHVHVAAIAVGGAIAWCVAFSIAQTGDALQTMGLVVLQLGASVLLLSTPALVTLVVAADLAWLAVAHPGEPWIEWGTILASSSAVALAAHAARLGTLRNLNSLRVADAQRRRELETALATAHEAATVAVASQERLRCLAEASWEAVCILDGQRIVDLNERFAELVGLDAAALPGLQFPMLLDRPLPADGGVAAAFMRSPTGPVPVEVRCRTHADTPGVRLVAVRDMRPQRMAEASGRLAADRLEQIGVLQRLNELKTQFINVASHELRTPLTPMLVQVALLRQGLVTDSDGQKRAVQVLERNLNRLSRLVEDLLDSARIQSDRLSLTPRAMDVEGMVADVVELLGESAAASGLTLEAAVTGPLWAEADPDRIHQVLLNLVGNALKFTPRGGRVQVRARPVEGNVHVEVCDTGIGVDAGDQGRLFQPFSQVHDLAQHPVAGSGLGLYISRGIVERHGGRMWCASPGRSQGATFGFSLPPAAAA